MNPSPEPSRFTDDGRRLEDFCHEIWVRCPRCDKLATISPAPGTQAAPPPLHRLLCPHCAAGREWPDKGLGMQDLDNAGGVTTIWGHPLWLQIPVEGQSLWALNPVHALHLRDYVGASLRERQWIPSTPWSAMTPPNSLRRKLGGSSTASRLPTWISRNHRRESILKALDKLITLTSPNSKS